MKLWTEPEIEVLSQPFMYGEGPEMWVGLAGSTPKGNMADGLAEVAGRSCYWSYGKGRKTNSEYLENIISSGHGSVLEHPTWTFGLKGISRSLSHELIRHRHLSFSQLSQRFVVEDPEYVVPPGIVAGDALAHFKRKLEAASDGYLYLLAGLPDTKAGREAARALLPNATATRIVVTGNARALRNMLALRGSLGADAEFRRLSVHWVKLMKALAPNIFADFEIREVEGKECVWAKHPKV